MNTESTHDAFLREGGLVRVEPKPPKQPRSIEEIAAAVYPNLIPNRDRKDRNK